MKIKKIGKPLILLFILAIFFASPTFAVNKSKAVSKEKPQINRLAEGKLRSCQAKEDALKKRAQQLEELAKNIEEKFDAIAQRVKEYYINKVVPSGKTVANYNNLVADIEIKKAAVQTVLIQTQTNVSNFSCTGDDPKGQMTKFRDDMQAVKSALKDYRDSINNLIVAVHSNQ